MGAIKPKFGPCNDCIEENNDNSEKLLYRVKPPECKYHYQKKKNQEYAERAKEKPKKKPKRIKPFSDKKLKDLSIYRVKRDRYLSDHKTCEVHDCNKRSTNLHHKAGRENSLLTDERYFMACCETCHPKRIHENPAWAREHGYILTVNLR